MNPLAVIIVVQVLFSVSNLLARSQMRSQQWDWILFTQLWLYMYLAMQLAGIFLQLYVFTTFELGKASTILSVIGVIASVALGWLVLGEKLSPLTYLAVIIAIIAILILGYSRRVTVPAGTMNDTYGNRTNRHK